MFIANWQNTRSSVLLEKLIMSYLFTKFHSFYGTGKFITLFFTKSYPLPFQTRPSSLILFLEDLFLYYDPIYVQVFQVVCFPQVFPPEPCIRTSLLLTCHIPLPITDWLNIYIYWSENYWDRTVYRRMKQKVHVRNVFSLIRKTAKSDCYLRHVQLISVHDIDNQLDATITDY